MKSYLQDFVFRFAGILGIVAVEYIFQIGQSSLHFLIGELPGLGNVRPVASFRPVKVADYCITQCGPPLGIRHRVVRDWLSHLKKLKNEKNLIDINLPQAKGAAFPKIH